MAFEQVMEANARRDPRVCKKGAFTYRFGLMHMHWVTDDPTNFCVFHPTRTWGVIDPDWNGEPPHETIKAYGLLEYTIPQVMDMHERWIENNIIRHLGGNQDRRSRGTQRLLKSLKQYADIFWRKE